MRPESFAGSRIRIYEYVAFFHSPAAYPMNELNVISALKQQWNTHLMETLELLRAEKHPLASWKRFQRLTWQQRTHILSITCTFNGVLMYWALSEGSHSKMVKHHLEGVIFWVSGGNAIPSAAIFLLIDLLLDRFWCHFHRRLPVFLSLAIIFITLVLLAAVGGSNQPILCSKSGSMQQKVLLNKRCWRPHAEFFIIAIIVCADHLPMILCQLAWFVADMKMCSILSIYCCSAHFSAVSCHRCCVRGSLGNVVCQSWVFTLLTWPVWVTFFQLINVINPWWGSFYWGR